MKTFTIVKLKTFVLEKMKKFARGLTKRTERLTAMKKILMLMLFSFSFSAISAYIIIDAFYSKSFIIRSPFIQRIPMSAHIGKNLKPNPPLIVSPQDFVRVQLVKKFLDSLAGADKNQYKLIMQNRPHLLDSIELFETIYLQNFKK